jgi:uncharacterized protein (DUF433 family)
MLVGLLASGRTHAEALEAYPYLEEDDLREALAYAAWRAEESEAPVMPAPTMHAFSPGRRRTGTS